MNEKIINAINSLSQKIDENIIPKTWLTVPEAGQYLNISESKVRKLVAEDRIPYNYVDRKIVFSIKKLDMWVLSDSQKTTFTKTDKNKLEILK